MDRAAGILLPVSSLPGPYGIGCFSRCAYRFIDWLKAAGQSYWQILPLGPTGYGDSPYQSFSTFAGNPYFISLEALTDEGVLTAAECSSADFGSDPSHIDYDALYQNRLALLRRAFERSRHADSPAYKAFLSENSWWLSDYALFMSLKVRFDGAPWTAWPKDIRLRRPEAMERYRKELAPEIAFQQFLQFKFIEQWRLLLDYAHSRGIRIIGDTPIYVAMDSADTWSHPELFQLDKNNVPTAVSAARPTVSPPPGSSGETRCTAGNITKPPDTPGGCPGFNTASGSMTCCALTISGVLTSTIPFHMERLPRQTGTGRRAPVSGCLTP